MKAIFSFFFKENVRCPVWTRDLMIIFVDTRDPILILGIRIGCLKHLKGNLLYFLLMVQF